MHIATMLKRTAFFHWIISSLTVLVAVTGFASLAGATYALPSSRSVTWQGNVGVSGDIPVRTTVYKTLSPSGGDDTSAIQSALNGCPAGQVVMLSAGTFKISSPLTVRSNTTLRGAGMGSTIIQGQSGASGDHLIGFNAGFSFGTSYNIVGGLSKGSTQIVTSSAHNFQPGDIILIDQLNNPSGNPPVNNTGTQGTASWTGRASGTRSIGQMVKVASVPNSTTVNLEIPLYWPYSSSLTPQATKYNGITSNAGIEALTVDNGLSGGTAQTGGNGGTAIMWASSNCWFSKVELIGSAETMLRMYHTYRCTLRECKLHQGIPTSAGNGSNAFAPSHAYGIWLGTSSACLVENNQIYHLYFGLKLDSPCMGNVIGYNYITDMYYYVASWEAAGWQMHGAHPAMNLFESNWVSSRVMADDIHGDSSTNTYFRNRIALDHTRSYGNWTINLETQSWYYNIIGNVLGTAGFENYYILDNQDISYSQYSIYRFGYTGDGDLTASGNDESVKSTVLLHGNWDSVHNGVIWNGTDDQVLPPSMYLASKPSWWGSMQWPCIGADISPMYPTPPGAGNGTPWGSANGTPPSSPTTLTVQ